MLRREILDKRGWSVTKKKQLCVYSFEETVFLDRSLAISSHRRHISIGDLG